MPAIVKAIIDSNALKNNLSRIKHFASSAKIMAILKDNAYGHGDMLVANILWGVDSIGLIRIEELISLRENGFTNKIVLFSGLYNEKIFDLCLKFNATPVITSLSQLSIIKGVKFAESTDIWVKIDTGMHRMGILPKEVSECYQELLRINEISNIHWMTHFACADQENNPQVIAQNDLFKKTTKNFPGLKSAANSAATIQYANTHYDIVRPGLMLYGASPIIGVSAEELGLKPVMTLKSRIVSVKQVMKGQSVGYGASWSPNVDSIVAIVGIGYGDGYPQFAPNGTPVLIGEARAQIAGRVSMDHLSIDITHLTNVKVGDEVTLWGKGLPVEEIALQAKQSPYSLLTGVPERIKRELI